MTVKHFSRHRILLLSLCVLTSVRCFDSDQTAPVFSVLLTAWTNNNT